MPAVLTLAGLAFALLPWRYWEQLFEAEGPAAQRRFRAWVCKGLLVPLLFWFGINCGLVPGMPILVREVALARARGGNWLGLLLESSGPVLYLAASCWSATTFGWLLPEIAARTKDRADFKMQCLFWSMLLLPVAGLVCFLSGPGGFGLALMMWLWPLVHFTLPNAQTKKSPPMYSPAVADLKFGKYRDAEAHVLSELEKHEDDFEGWMMLADLYANHFNDLVEADRTIRALCAQPNVSSVQISRALHRLADWHINLGTDPVGGRSALEEICARLPDTHFARMARLRIDQLPATREELLEQRKPKTFKLPALRSDLEEAPGVPESDEELAAARNLADRCVARLRQNPDDIAARDEFARLLAERLGHAELAIEQLELLLAMPNQPEQRAAEWLARIAAWEMKYRHDWDAARVVLERIIREYPQSPQAFASQRRLSQMEMDRRFQKARALGL